MTPLVPGDEAARVAALREARILDTPREDAFDDLTALAARLCGAPIALIGLVDEDRLWFKSTVGLNRPQIPRDVAFCAQAILRPDLFVVPDATLDPRFAANQLVVSDPHIRFYAGAPLVTSDGFALGTLSVIDHRPRQMPVDQQATLRALSRQVVALIELRRVRGNMERLFEEYKAALYTSEEDYRALFDRAPFGVFRTSPEGRILAANGAVARILGYASPAELRAAVTDITAEVYADPARREEFRAALREHGAVTGFEAEIKRRDGARAWASLSARVARAADGRPLVYEGILEDITERKRAEQERHLALERVTDAFVALDRDWRYTYVNARAGEIFGRRPEDLVGKHIWTEFPEAVGHPFHRAYERAMESQQPITFEEFYPPYQRWFENRIHPSPEGLSIYFSDVTERKRVEHEMRDKADALDKLSRHLEQAQAIARLGSWEIDPFVGRGLWSAEMYRLLGRAPGAGPPTMDEFLELVHPADRAAFHSAQGRATAGPPVRFTFRTNPAFGPVRRLESSATAVSRAGRTFLEGTTQDVTDREELAERERRARAVADMLAEANLALAQEGEVETVLETFLDQLARLVPYDSANVMLLEEGRRLGVRAARGYERWTDAAATARIVFDPESNPVFAAILGSGRPVLLRDSLQEPGWQRVAGAEHVRSWLGVPLVQRGRTVGLFSVDKAEPGFFTDEHARLAQALAPAAATAIENARLLAETREQEARLRLAVGAGKVGLFDWNLRTNRVRYSREWKQQIGYEEHEIADDLEDWQSRYHPADVPRMLDTVRRYVEEPWPDYEAEFRFRHKDGSYRWILTRADHQRGADGKPVRMLGCHIDITDRKRIEEALGDSERRLRNLFEQAADGIFVITADHRYLDANAAGLRMLGYDRDELLGMRLPDVLAEHERHRLETEVPRMMAGVPHLAEWVHLRKDGTTFPAEVSARVLAGEEYLAIVRDITQRRRAEEDLRKSEERLQLFVRHAPAAIAMFDTRMRYLAVSDRWLSDYRLGRDDLIGCSHYDVFPEIPERWKRIHARVLAGAAERAEAEPFERADGSIDWVQWEMLPWRTAEGSVGGALLFTEVVTERKRLEEERERLLDRERRARETAEASRQLLRDLIDGLGPSLFVGLLTPDGKIVEANRPALQAAGLAPADVLGKPVDETYWWSHSEDAQRRVREAVARAAAGQSSRYDERIRAAGDTLITIDFSLEPLFDQQGCVRYIVPSGREISDRVRAEESLRHRETMAALGSLVAGVAHEIRNPLFALTATLDAFEERFPANQPPHLAVLRRELQRLTNLATDLLDYGRPQRLDLRLLSPAELLSEAVRNCDRLAQERGVRLTGPGEGALPPIVGDRGRLLQVFDNVIDNALRHSSAGGGVTVVASLVREASGEWLECRVEDSGPGFAAEALTRVFEPFYSLRKGGTGLGLSIARRVVELHGGTIAAANRSRGGAVVTVRLPLAGPKEAP